VAGCAREPVSSDLGRWIEDRRRRSNARGLTASGGVAPVRGGEVTRDGAGAGSRGFEVARVGKYWRGGSSNSLAGLRP
jgi:hypothetical protein